MKSFYQKSELFIDILPKSQSHCICWRAETGSKRNLKEQTLLKTGCGCLSDTTVRLIVSHTDAITTHLEIRNSTSAKHRRDIGYINK